MALVVAELYEQRLFVKLLNDGSDLPTSQALNREVRQQCHHIQRRWHLSLRAAILSSLSTQHVTNLDTFSPVRTIHNVLTTTLFDVA